MESTCWCLLVFSFKLLYGSFHFPLLFFVWFGCFSFSSFSYFSILLLCVLFICWRKFKKSRLSLISDFLCFFLLNFPLSFDPKTQWCLIMSFTFHEGLVSINSIVFWQMPIIYWGMAVNIDLFNLILLSLLVVYCQS